MDSDEELPPGERQGGKPIGESEAREKGTWAARADEGIVPAELADSDADESPTQDTDLDSSVLGTTTGSDEPATEGGVDLAGGENADATTDGGPTPTPGGEPDLKDAGTGPRPSDSRSTE